MVKDQTVACSVFDEKRIKYCSWKNAGKSTAVSNVELIWFPPGAQWEQFFLPPHCALEPRGELSFVLFMCAHMFWLDGFYCKAIELKTHRFEPTPALNTDWHTFVQDSKQHISSGQLRVQSMRKSKFRGDGSWRPSWALHGALHWWYIAHGGELLTGFKLHFQFSERKLSESKLPARVFKTILVCI